MSAVQITERRKSRVYPLKLVCKVRSFRPQSIYYRFESVQICHEFPLEDHHNSMDAITDEKHNKLEEFFPLAPDPL